MKVLIWVGSPAGVYGWEHDRDLVRVWVDDHRKVHVEALAPEFEEFARAVQDNIDRRVADPRAIFMRLTGNSWKTRDGTWKSVTRQEVSKPGEDNFLQVLKSDRDLVANRKGQGIAGYELYDNASRIVEE